jgi:hypothetical protein
VKRRGKTDGSRFHREDFLGAVLKVNRYEFTNPERKVDPLPAVLFRHQGRESLVIVARRCAERRHGERPFPKDLTERLKSVHRHPFATQMGGDVSKEVDIEMGRLRSNPVLVKHCLEKTDLDRG